MGWHISSSYLLERRSLDPPSMVPLSWRGKEKVVGAGLWRLDPTTNVPGIVILCQPLPAGGLLFFLLGEKGSTSARFLVLRRWTICGD